eukprot:UN15676
MCLCFVLSAMRGVMQLHEAHFSYHRTSYQLKVFLADAFEQHLLCRIHS